MLFQFYLDDNLPTSESCGRPRTVKHIPVKCTNLYAGYPLKYPTVHFVKSYLKALPINITEESYV